MVGPSDVDHSHLKEDPPIRKKVGDTTSPQTASVPKTSDYSKFSGIFVPITATLTAITSTPYQICPACARTLWTEIGMSSGTTRGGPQNAQVKQREGELFPRPRV